MTELWKPSKDFERVVAPQPSVFDVDKLQDNPHLKLLNVKDLEGIKLRLDKENAAKFAVEDAMFVVKNVSKVGEMDGLTCLLPDFERDGQLVESTLPIDSRLVVVKDTPVAVESTRAQDILDQAQWSMSDNGMITTKCRYSASAFSPDYAPTKKRKEKDHSDKEKKKKKLKD